MRKQNLLKETEEALVERGKSLSDIEWVGCSMFQIDIGQFLELMLITIRATEHQKLPQTFSLSEKTFGLNGMSMTGLNGGSLKHSQRNQMM